jgi:hypothetical protein
VQIGLLGGYRKPAAMMIIEMADHAAGTQNGEEGAMQILQKHNGKATNRIGDVSPR